MWKWLLFMVIVLCLVAGGVYFYYYDGWAVLQKHVTGDPVMPLSPVVSERRSGESENMPVEGWDIPVDDTLNILRSLDMEPYVTYDNLPEALYCLSTLYGNSESAETWANNKSMLSSKPDYYRERRVPRDMVLRALYHATGQRCPYYLPVEMDSYSLGYMSGEEFMSYLELYIDDEQSPNSISQVDQ